jgi:beta-lactamase class A
VSILGPDAGRYGVVVRNLTDGTEAAVQPDRVFYAASLYKLAILYEVYRQERQGRIDFSQTLTITEDAAEQDLGTLDLLGWSAGSVITVAQAIEAMITVSDNASAVLLGDLVGWHNVDQGLRELGLRSTRVNDPELPVTAADLARLLDRIACGQAVDEQASREMIELLTRQRVRDRLPALLPEGVVIANKTGNWTNATHDAGIVYSPRATYVIVVLSETAWQSEPIAQLSAAVYAYFNPPTGTGGTPENGDQPSAAIAPTSSREASAPARRLGSRASGTPAPRPASSPR